MARTRKPIQIGEKLGRLTVIEYAGKRRHQSQFLCKCECGNEVVVVGTELRTGHTKSCGCLFKETLLNRITKHNKRYERLYEIWRGMRQRCNNPNKKTYKNYGGRGIKVCEEWNDFETFYDWAVNNGYEKNLTLDRIDVNGNYEPDNCRWADVKTQANNKRNSRYIEAYGEKHTVAEWAEKMQIKPTTLYSRLKKGCTNAELLRPVERRGAL